VVSYLRHFAAGLVIFGIMVSLYSTLYLGVEESYNLTRTGDVNGTNIMQQLDGLTIVTAMNESASEMYNILNPKNPTDLLGAMALVGFSIMKIIGSLILLPFQIFGILVQFYFIPTIIVTGILVLIILYVGFILLSAYMKERI